MEYRNRGKRCKHGLLTSIKCPGCDPKLLADHRSYIPSQSSNIVNNNRKGSSGRKRIGEGEPVPDHTYHQRVGR